jgi:hypothetical protein
MHTTTHARIWNDALCAVAIVAAMPAMMAWAVVSLIVKWTGKHGGA